MRLPMLSLAPPASAPVTLLTVSLTALLSELSEELNCSPAFVSDPVCWLPALLKLPVANVVGANLLLPVARRLVLAGVLGTVLLWPLVAAAPPMRLPLIAMPESSFVTI